MPDGDALLFDEIVAAIWGEQPAAAPPLHRICAEQGLVCFQKLLSQFIPASGFLSGSWSNERREYTSSHRLNTLQRRYTSISTSDPLPQLSPALLGPRKPPDIRKEQKNDPPNAAKLPEIIAWGEPLDPVIIKVSVGVIFGIILAFLIRELCMSYP